MNRLLKTGPGWRIGWKPQPAEFQGLVGTDDWAVELTAAELQDFCRLLTQLAETMTELADELMAEEKIDCEAESDLLWLEVSGYHHTYTLRLILNSRRGVEGKWQASAIPGLLQAAQTLQVF
jgi:frataxin-like iron-binding protein CyaY